MFRFLSNEDVRWAFTAHRRRLLLAAVSILGRSGLALAGPHYLGRGIDLVVSRAGADPVRRAALALLAFSAGTAFCQFWMRWLWIGWSRFTEAHMRGSLFQHLLRLPSAYFDRARTGDLLSRLTADVEMVRMGYGPGLMHALQPVIMTLGAVIMMTRASVPLTLASLLPLGLLFLVMRGLLPRIHDESTAVQERQAELSSKSQETFSGARVIKAFGREAHEDEGFGEISGRFAEDSVRLARTRARFSCLIELFSSLLIVVVLAVGGWLVLDGAITLGVYAAFNAYLQQLIWPMIAMGWTLSLFTRAESAERRVSAVLSEPREHDGAARSESPAGLTGRIEVRGLSFTYPGAPSETLSGVSFDLAPGRTLGIVGATGSGKSTIPRLLSRLHSPPRGTVFLDGMDVLDRPLDQIRKGLAMVPQESFLFSDTIRNNIALARDGASDDAVLRAVDIACLTEAIATFPEGLSTEVGERGISLSDGQRQRTAIARAVLADAPILVLDDALSAVDTETEKQILANLAPVMADRTTIIISHRVSAVRRADEILVLDSGKVVERGRHDELVAKGGAYARIQRLQETEDELETL